MRKSLLLLLPLVLLPVDGIAATTPVPPPQLGLCAACHGRDGHARIPGAPNLAGQRYQYLLQALHEYRNGERKVPVMQAAAGPLTEKEMQALAHWFASQSPCPPGQVAHP